MIKAFSKKFTAIIVLLTMFIVSVVIGVSYSWLFIGSNEVNLQLDSGSFILQYFHCGKGTKEEPFVITRPIHYYHMVELYQRRSDFAKGNLENAIGEPYYFQIGYNIDNSKDGSLEVYNYDDTGAVVTNVNGKGSYKNTQYSDTLNMAYYSGSLALLPMGTSAVPFIGELDGSGMTVKNLHITATETVGTTVYKTSDVGVFGYIGGEYDTTTGAYEGGFVHDVYYENITIDISGLDSAVDEPKNEDGELVNNPALVHRDHKNGDVYIGYLVGHLPVIRLDENGYDADSIFSEVYINNCQVIGGEYEGKNVVEYGYIGHLDLLQYPDLQPTTIRSIIEYIQSPGSGTGGSGEEGGEGSGSGGGQESGGTGEQGVLPGWGGSLDMKNFYTKMLQRKTDSATTWGSTLIDRVNWNNYAHHSTSEIVEQRVVGKDAQGNDIKIVTSREVTGTDYDGGGATGWLAIRANAGKFRAYNAGVDNFEGSYYFYDSVIDFWICFSSSSEHYDKTVTVFTTYEGEDAKTAMFLQQVVNDQKTYISRTNGSTSISKTTKIQDASPFAFYEKEDEMHVLQPTNYIYTNNVGEETQYFLNTNGESIYFTSASTPASNFTEWYVVNDADGNRTNDHIIYTVINGVKFYLINGKDYCGYENWIVVPETFTKIKIDGSNYLKYDGSKLVKTTEADATNWIFANGKLFTLTSGGYVYLTNNNWKLTTSTTSPTTTWSKDGNGQFYLNAPNANSYIVDGNKFFPTGNNTFILLQKGFTTTVIKEGSNYLSSSGTSFSVTSTKASATNFIKEKANDSDGGDYYPKFYTFIDDKRYYLNATKDGVSFGESSTTTWIYEQEFNALFITDGSYTVSTGLVSTKTIVSISSGSHEYYLHYDNGWKMAELSLAYDKIRIFSQNDEHRFFRDGTGSKKNTNNVWEAKYWTLADGALYCEDSGENHYLKGNDGGWFGLTLVDIQNSSSGATNWSLVGDDHKIHWSGDGGRYLRWYGASSGWKTGTEEDMSCIAIGRPNPASAMTFESGVAIDAFADTTIGNSFTPYSYTSEMQTDENEQSVEVITSETYYITIEDGIFASDVTQQIEDATNYTYIPIMTKTDKEFDSDLTSEYAASHKNTGYIVSGAHENNTGVDASDADVRVRAYSMDNTITGGNITVTGGITNSLDRDQYNDEFVAEYGEDASTAFANTKFGEVDDRNLEILTRDPLTGEFVRIKDADIIDAKTGTTPSNLVKHNTENANPSTTLSSYSVKTVQELGLKGYQDLEGYYDEETKTIKYRQFARDNLFNMMNGDNNVYGLRFMSETVSADNKILAKNVRLLETDYEEYELPISCVDFKVEAAGRVSFFAGCWAAGESPDAFFSLSRVFRNNDNTISDIKEIRKIYKGSKGYLYYFTDGTYYDGMKFMASSEVQLSFYTLVFDMEWINPADGLDLVNNTIYYFEIPVGAGEYALGSVANHTGAYLLYLDVGANSSHPTVPSEEGGESGGGSGEDDGDLIEASVPNAVISSDAVFTNLDYRVYGQTIDRDTLGRHRSIMTFAYGVPDEATNDNFSIEVVYQGVFEDGQEPTGEDTNNMYNIKRRDDYADTIIQVEQADGSHKDVVEQGINVWCKGVYQIYIKNTTGNEMYLSVLLTDNDDDMKNEFPYAYEILIWNEEANEYVVTQNVEMVGGEEVYNGTLRRWSNNYHIASNGSVSIG